MAAIDPKVICRLCAKGNEFCVDVFGDDGVRNNLSKKIRLCLPVTVSIIQHIINQIIYTYNSNYRYTHV